MYIYHCDDCGADFDDAIEVTIAEHYGARDYGMGCPYCESGDFCKNTKCAKCGDSFPENKMQNNLCLNCQKEVQNKLTKLLENLSDEEKDYLWENLDDLWDWN